MQIENIIFLLLFIAVIYLLYYVSTSYTIVKNDKHLESFVNPDKKTIDKSNYNYRADIVIEDKDLDNIIDNLVAKKEMKNNEFELITKTDQNEMFDDLEQKIINQYDNITMKDGFYKDIQRPLQGSSLPSTKEVPNSSLNPVMNPDMFNVKNEDKTIWEVYDNMTCTNHKNNYDNLEPNDISVQYVLGNNNKYGSSFDNYSLNN